MLQLTLNRNEFSDERTIGDLLLDGEWECYTLEDAVRPVKIAGMTAIPAGAYEVILNWSERFQTTMPLLLNVPQFDGVRIHTGNTEHDTEGCILVGATKTRTSIGKSRDAFAVLFKTLSKAATRGKIFIEIRDNR